MGAGGLDEATQGDQIGGEGEVEINDLAVAVGDAAEFAVVVHPGMQAFHGPTLAGLNGGCGALAGDDAGEAMSGEDRSTGGAIVAGVEMNSDLAGKGAAR